MYYSNTTEEQQAARVEAFRASLPELSDELWGALETLRAKLCDKFLHCGNIKGLETALYYADCVLSALVEL
jgi:hypothetical protein